MENSRFNNESSARKPVDDEDDCRRVASVTCHNNTKGNKGHASARRFASDAFHVRTERLSVQSRGSDVRNKIVRRKIAIQRDYSPSIPEQQIRGKVCEKFVIPDVMGEVLSRASSIFSGRISNDQPEDSDEIDAMASPEEALSLEDVTEWSSGDGRYRNIDENSTATPRENEIEDSGINADESELAESLTPDFQFPDNGIPSRSSRRPTPFYRDSQPVGNLTGPRNASMYSQSTPSLPGFRQSFGSGTSSNFSRNAALLLTLNQSLPNTQPISGPGFGDRDSIDSETTEYQPPLSITPSTQLSDSQGFVNPEPHHENSALSLILNQSLTSTQPISGLGFGDRDSIDSQMTEYRPSLSITPSTQLLDSRGIEVHHENSNDSNETQSTDTLLEQLDTQIVVYPGTDHEDFNDGDEMHSAETILDLLDAEGFGNRESRALAEPGKPGQKYSTKKRPGIPDSWDTREVVGVSPDLTGSMISSLNLTDSQCGLSLQAPSTQNYSQCHEDFRRNFLANRVRSEMRLQGEDCRRKPDPESLWTDTEETCATGSPIVGIPDKDNFSSPQTVRKPYNISMGTKLSPPAFLSSRTQTPFAPETEQSYRRKTGERPRVRRSIIVESKSDADLFLVDNDEDESLTGISDFSNSRIFEHGRGRKITKRKVDCLKDKENLYVEYSDVMLDRNPVKQKLRFDISDDEQDFRSPEDPPPKKKTRRSLTDRRSSIARRALTPYYHKKGSDPALAEMSSSHSELENTQKSASTPGYPTQKNIGQRVLTPFHGEKKHIEKRALTPFYSKKTNIERRDPTIYLSSREKKEPEMVDLTDDIKEEDIVEEFSTNGITEFEIQAAENSQLPVSPSDVQEPIVTELFSNRCSEYDHSFSDMNCSEILAYVPDLLKDLFEATDEEIERNISQALESLNDLCEDQRCLITE